MENISFKSKIWGGFRVRLNPFNLNALKLKYVLEDLKDVEGDVLDAGCGAGGMTKAIKYYRPDLKLVGVDISKKAVNEAKKDAQGVEFLYGDVTNLSEFKEETFDAVVTFDVLEHLGKPEESLKEVYRVLKPSGVFSALVPLDGSIFTIHGIAKKLGFIPKKKYAGHVQQFSEADVLRLLTDSGLRLEKKRYSQHYFHQVIDFLYFSLLYLSRKNVSYSVESYLGRARSGFKPIILGFLKSLVAALSFYESVALKPLPGLGVSITASKRVN